MLTPSHGLLAWLLGKLFSMRPGTVRLLVFGSVVPDTFMLLFGAVKFLWGESFIRNIFDIWLAKYPTAVFHSFPLLLLIYGILQLLLFPKTDKINGFFAGLFFHSTIDFFTHKTSATNISGQFLTLSSA